MINSAYWAACACVCLCVRQQLGDHIKKQFFLCVFSYSSQTAAPGFQIRLIGRQWQPVMDEATTDADELITMVCEVIGKECLSLGAHHTHAHAQNLEEKTQTVKIWVSSLTPWSEHPNKANRTSENSTFFSRLKQRSSDKKKRTPVWQLHRKKWP